MLNCIENRYVQEEISIVILAKKSKILVIEALS
jgi:hypothetical protein